MAQVVHKVRPAIVRERIRTSPKQIAAFCRAHHIRWLALFGSVLRDDFRNESDVDVLYALESGYRITSMGDLLAIEDTLSALMRGRKVDFISVQNLKWRIRNRVFAEAEPLYGDPPEEVVHARELRSLHGDRVVRDENLYIGDMLDNAREAQEIVNGKTRDDYDTNRMLQLSVLHLVQTIGEAATKVSRQTRALHPGIPWSDVIGMRNVLVHRYVDVDDEVVWKTVTDDLASLIVELERMLPPEMRAEP
ncbi:MAG: DUF86 domain-containing protein [Thermomicrobia bacterium]|nr:DUF86 domain-containing protein [Thermomicrobia bacterium]